MVTLIFLAKKLARAGKPCLVTLLPGGVAWSVTLTSALGQHKAKGWAPGSVAQGKPTWEQGKQGKSRVRFFQGVPDLVRGGSSGRPWPGSSEQVSKVSLEFDFPGGSRPGSRREVRWSVAWLLGTIPKGLRYPNTHLLSGPVVSGGPQPRWSLGWPVAEVPEPRSASP